MQKRKDIVTKYTNNMSQWEDLFFFFSTKFYLHTSVCTLFDKNCPYTRSLAEEELSLIQNLGQNLKALIL